MPATYRAASPAFSSSSYEHILFGTESDDDVIVYHPPTSTSKATTAGPHPGAGAANAPYFRFKMVPWADDRSDGDYTDDEIVFGRSINGEGSAELGLRDRTLDQDVENESVVSDGTEDLVILSRPRSRARKAAEAESQSQTHAIPTVSTTTIEAIESALSSLDVQDRSREETITPRTTQQSPTPPPSPGGGRRRRKSTKARARVNNSANPATNSATNSVNSAKPKPKLVLPLTGPIDIHTLPLPKSSRKHKHIPVLVEVEVEVEDELPDTPTPAAMSAAYDEASRYIT
jgi:hypothetical protein